MIIKLIKQLKGDHNFKGNTILGSMCSEPHFVAKFIYRYYISTNVGDPGLFPRLKKLEEKYISQLGELLGNRDAKGMVVTGGSEANILAMWTARNLAKEYQREVIVPESCHFSFEKAAALLNLKLIRIPLNGDFKVRTDLVANAISKNTMAIVGIAGSTPLGVTDDIVTLSNLAIEHNVYLHVDAAFGGFVLPFLNSHPQFDFSLPGVSSITIDPHKMGRSVIQSGCILYRNSDIFDAVQIHVNYLSGGRTVHNTLLGTRSGASIAASWGIYNYLGAKGYKKIVNRAMDLTLWLRDRIKEIDGVDIVAEPELNIIGVTSSRGVDIKIILKRLRLKGWALSEWDNHFRITLMPHVKKTPLRNS
jgi:tyrosine decarboxylase / aspartate 1-decarboxylase